MRITCRFLGLDVDYYLLEILIIAIDVTNVVYKYK